MKKLDAKDIANLLNTNKPTEAAAAAPVLHSDIQRKHPLALCEQCPIYKTKTHGHEVITPFAPTHGNPESKVAFVSRSPGQYDVSVKKPFANPRGAGAVLDHLLGRYGVKRDDVITTNVVLCRSDDPPKEAIQACKPRLESEIANCDLVILGGTEATSAFTRYRAVFTARPFLHRRTSSTGVKQRVVVTNNPALVVRNSDAYPDMVEDFRRAFDPPPDPVFPKVDIINDPVNARDILERWRNDLPPLMASDLEWRSTTDEPVCAGFSARGEKAVVFGLRVLSDERCWDLLRWIYEDVNHRYIWHNGKVDTSILVKAGVNGRIDEDTFLMSYALDERPGYHSLEYLLSTKFGWPDYEPPSVKEFKKTGEFSGKTAQERALAEKELYKYNGWDTAGTYQLFNTLDPLLDTDRGGSVRPVYKRLLKAQTAFRTVELNGFNYDVEESANINEREAMPLLAEYTEHIREITGHALVNPNSPDQLRAIIYGEWGLKHSLRDSGKKKLQTSTGKEVREEIEAGRFTCKPNKQERMIRWAGAQRQYSKVSKLKGTYLEGLAIRTLQDGKLYCHFNPCGTVSGRTSSKNPNFQNVAREGYAEIPGIKTLFLPSRDHVIIQADFSQAELRTCAKLSGDSNLLAIYRDSSRSLHKERAAAFYGETYTKEEYVKSKNINFGVTYGQSAAAFAQMYHMPQEEAQEYINSWWGEFPDLLAWTDDLKAQARKEGLVVSPFGHKRRFHLITDENVGDVEREAVNFKPQNIAAWLTISAMCELVDIGVRVVATVHDSIVCDCPIDNLDDCALIMKQTMEKQAVEQLGWDDIPFLVDVSYGRNWGTLEDYEFAPAPERIAA
jgi:uracil-DNA glycosylase family 4